MISSSGPSANPLTNTDPADYLCEVSYHPGGIAARRPAWAEQRGGKEGKSRGEMAELVRHPVNTRWSALRTALNTHLRVAGVQAPLSPYRLGIVD